ncbi:MAG: N-acetylglucosamine kinase [Bacteroidota bacterium]
MAITRFVIGIDGGGTKSHALICALDGEVIAEAKGGPSNLQIIGIPQTTMVLFDLIQRCCQQANCGPESIQAIVMGLAGAGRAAEKAELVDKLFALGNEKQFPLRNVTIETDAKIALDAAFAGGPGIVIIAGTGSIALYRTETNQILRAGGWGRILGDEGGGYAISRHALNIVLRHHDGRIEETILTQKVLDHFKIVSVEELIPKVYFQSTDIAAFAPKVFDAALKHDHVAQKILTDNAIELVDLARVLLKKVPPKRKIPIALMGGILEFDNPYSKLVAERTRAALPQIVIQKPKFPAAYGAVIIGLHAFRA